MSKSRLVGGVVALGLFGLATVGFVQKGFWADVWRGVGRVIGWLTG